MSRHLIDDIAVGWDELGTDLLDAAPPALVTALTGGEQWPSRTLDHLITPDGSPPVRMTVTADTADAQDLQWGYILRPQGIEVISVPYATAGHIVGWDSDPLVWFSDHPGHWPAPAPAPAVATYQTATPVRAPDQSRPAPRR